MTRPPVPSWWPIEGEPIGLDRAAELVEYLKHVAPKVVAFAKAHMEAQHPGHEVRVRANTARQIAREKLVPESGDIWIGSLSIGEAGTLIAQALVTLDRGGRVRVTFVAQRGEPTWTVAYSG